MLCTDNRACGSIFDIRQTGRCPSPASPAPVGVRSWRTAQTRFTRFRCLRAKRKWLRVGRTSDDPTAIIIDCIVGIEHLDVGQMSASAEAHGGAAAAVIADAGKPVALRDRDESAAFTLCQLLTRAHSDPLPSSPLADPVGNPSRWLDRAGTDRSHGNRVDLWCTWRLPLAA